MNYTDNDRDKVEITNNNQMISNEGKVGASFERSVELDCLKVFAIIAMIICHAVYMLGAHKIDHAQDIEFFIGDIVFGEYLAVAHAFMFAMGVGVVFSKKDKPRELIKRGVLIYIAGFVLNFFRYGIYALIDGIIEGQFMDETAYAFLVQDIFHFAGLALMFTGGLKALKLREWHIFAVGVVLSMIGSPLAFCFDGHPVLNYILGHFIVTNKQDSTFAFFNWYVFVGFGMLFGRILKNSTDKDRLYRIVLSISAPVLIVYITLSFIFGEVFLTKNGWYYAVSLPEAVGLLSIDMTLLSVFYFLTAKAPKQKLAPIIEISKNLTPIYCVQWCVIGFVDCIFCYLLEWIIPYWAQYIFGVALIFISIFAAEGWRILQKKYREKKKNV